MHSRLLIVEDHPLYAEALQSVISSSLENVQITLAPDIATAAEIIGNGAYIDLVILDLKLPDSNGLEGLIELKTRAPSLPVIVTSAFADPEVVHNVIVCGGASFVSKGTNKSILLREIRDVLQGRRGRVRSEAAFPNGEGINGTNGANGSNGLNGSKGLNGSNGFNGANGINGMPRLSALTRQQMRVLRMLCQGLLNKQIAHYLGINESTVKAHVSEILRKLRVASRTQAVVTISHLSEPKGMLRNSAIAE